MTLAPPPAVPVGAVRVDALVLGLVVAVPAKVRDALVTVGVEVEGVLAVAVPAVVPPPATERSTGAVVVVPAWLLPPRPPLPPPAPFLARGEMSPGKSSLLPPPAVGVAVRVEASSLSELKWKKLDSS